MPGRRLTLLAPALLLGRGGAWAQASAPLLRIAGLSQLDPQAWVAQQLLGEIYRRSGLGLQIEALPPARATLSAQADRVDGELMRTFAYGLEHPELLRVTPPFYRVAVHAFWLRGRALTVRSSADLQRYSVCALRGVSFVPLFTRGHPALTLVQNGAQMFRMLESGRVDLVLNGLFSSQVIQARLQLVDIETSPELGRLELFHYLRPQRAREARLLGDTIHQLRASGELERLTARYEKAALTSS